nr:YihY/virulence factor BrkB family protein [Helcococcus sueciensis]
MRKIENFIRYFIIKMTKSESDVASAYLAFYIILAFIPLVSFLSNMIVFVVPNFVEFVYEITENLPKDVQNILNPLFDSLFGGSSSSLSIVSIISALWLGSRGFQGLITALNKIFDVNSNSKIPFYTKIFSVIYTIAFMIVLASILLFNVFNEKILLIIKSIAERFDLIDGFGDFLVNGITTILPLIFTILVLAFFYRFAPSFERYKAPEFKSIILGSIVGTLGVAFMTFFYRYTNDVLTKKPSVYGSLGSILVTLVWLLAICNMIIIGAVFIKTFEDVVINKKTIKDLDPDAKYFTKIK